MPITNKTDWLNDKLAKKGLLVSSHHTFNTYLGYDNQDYDISLRFIGNISIGYNYILVIITDELNNFKATTQIKNTILKLSALFNKSVYTLVSANTKTDMNFLVSTNGVDFDLHDSDGLKLFFTKINHNYTQDIGVTKELNKSINDNFQQWTRNNLSKFITINDFDAISIHTPSAYILELKRVEEDINTWLPYLDDYANYKACDNIIKSLKLDLNHFRTIAYNINNENEIAICMLISIEKDKYKLFKEVTTLDNIFKQPKYFESCNRRI
jgi:hypothetical protein